jgi:hypothetical protein
MGFTEPFLSYRQLKPKSRVFLIGCIVAMVAYSAMKITATCLTMIAHLCYTNIVTYLGKVW